MITKFQVAIKDRPDWTEVHTKEAYEFLRLTGVGKPLYFNDFLRSPIGFCLGVTLENLNISCEFEFKKPCEYLIGDLELVPYVTLPFYNTLCFYLWDSKKGNPLPVKVTLEN